MTFYAQLAVESIVGGVGIGIVGALIYLILKRG